MQFIKSLDYFFVLRPILFFPGWSTLLAGYFIASNDRLWFGAVKAFNHDYRTICFLVFAFAAAMGASFLLNQLEDIESDLKNKKLFFLAEGILSPKAIKLETLFLIAVSIILAAMVNEAVLMAIVAFLLITAYGYNYKPFLLKDFPWRSLLANALMGWLAFMIGALAVNTFSLALVIKSLPYLFFNTSLYFFTTLPDMHGDKKSEKKTLAVIHGFSYVTNMAIGFFAIGVILAVLLKDYFALYFMVPVIPFYLGLLTKKEVGLTIKTTKYALLFFGIAICIKIPFYFVLMIAIFAFTKWYFIKRFNYNYPNLKGE